MVKTLHKEFISYCNNQQLEVNSNQIEVVKRLEQYYQGNFQSYFSKLFSKKFSKKGKFWRKPGYIGFRSANAHHRVDLKEGTKPMTIFIPGPFGLRKGPRSEYGIDFKTKKD